MKRTERRLKSGATTCRLDAWDKSEFGTYFIGYSRSPHVTEQMIENMFVGRLPGNYDRILDSVVRSLALSSSYLLRLSLKQSLTRRAAVANCFVPLSA